MNNPQIKTEIWKALRQKWIQLDAEGHTVKVDFNILKDPRDSTEDLAMDVAQNIDGEWVVQTVQRKPGEACRVLGIAGLELGQLIELARQLVHSAGESAAGENGEESEVHLVMKRISPETSEISGHVISRAGEKVSLRTNYQHYYVLNEILEQTAQTRQKQYSELRLHRDKGQGGSISFQVVPAR